MNLPMKLLHHDFLTALIPSPRYETDGAAGIDLRAMMSGTMDVVVPVGGRVTFDCGFAMALHHTVVGLVCPRSGLAAKFGLTVLNGPGVIDSDYRGEVRVILQNLDRHPFTVRHGDRIGQLVIVPVIHAEPEFVEDLDATSRGAGGFGSTGR